ncbi:MAG: heavy-metal-associated domain-containing protein [Sporomusa sp.]
MSTAIIIIVLVIICVLAVYSYIKKIRHGSGCCGEHEALDKKVKVADRNKDHYPYSVKLTIDGMVCGNCVRRVENSLNSMDGIWAKVDLGSKQAEVLGKDKVDNEILVNAIRDTGYTVLTIE